MLQGSNVGLGLKKGGHGPAPVCADLVITTANHSAADLATMIPLKTQKRHGTETASGRSDGNC